MAYPDIGDYRKIGAKASGPPPEQRERRAANRMVRSVRDRARSFSGTSLSFDKALLRSFTNTQRLSLTSLLFFATVVAGYALLFSPEPPPNEYVLAWISLFGLLLLNTTIVSKKYMQTIEDEVAPHKWERKFTILTFASTLVWAVSILYAGLTPNVADEIFMIGISVGYAAVIAILYSSIPNANRICIMTLVVFEIFVVINNPLLISELIISFSIVSQLILMFLSKTMFEIHSIAVSSEAEKDQLIIELELEKTKAVSEAQRAEEANASKSRFLAAMSHELRTPMNAILGFSEVMLNEVLGPHNVPQYKEYSEDIHNSGQHLLKLINELLDLSKIEAGHHKLTEESCSLTEITTSCVRMMKMRAQEGGLQLVENYEKRLPNIWADNKAIRQVLLNLISNGIKFTRTGGAITVTVGWTAGGGQYLSVSDTGQGIPEKEIPVVMSSFGQGSQSSATSDSGTGLGLPITKSLVEMHGGKFILTSEVGVGTQVLAAFPPERVIDPSSVRLATRKKVA